MIGSVRVILCFQAEGVARAVYTASLANVSLIHIIGSVEMDTRHSCVYLHCNSSQIRSRNRGRPERTNRTVYHIILIISFRLNQFGVRVFNMCFD